MFVNLFHSNLNPFMTKYRNQGIWIMLHDRVIRMSFFCKKHFGYNNRPATQLPGGAEPVWLWLVFVFLFLQYTSVIVRDTKFLNDENKVKIQLFFDGSVFHINHFVERYAGYIVQNWKPGVLNQCYSPTFKQQKKTITVWFQVFTKLLLANRQ